MNKGHYSLIILLLALLLITAFFVYPNKKRLAEKEKELQQVQEENKQLNRQLNEIKRENKELEENDPNRLTKAARDTYKYVRPEDKVFHFPENN